MAKYLSEADWKTVTQKHKVKDTTLQMALAAYAKVSLDKVAERQKAIAQILKAAASLKKAKECMAQPEVLKYLGEVIKAAEVEKKQIDIDVQAAAAKTPAPPPKPDPKMLDEVFHVGMNDGQVGTPSRGRLFEKAPDFKKKYDDGYAMGQKVAERIRAKGPQPRQTSMGPISKEDAERNMEYTRRKQSRKEFVQYLNQWWKTRLPEDL